MPDFGQRLSAANPWRKRLKNYNLFNTEPLGGFYKILLISSFQKTFATLVTRGGLSAWTGNMCLDRWLAGRYRILMVRFFSSIYSYESWPGVQFWQWNPFPMVLTTCCVVKTTTTTPQHVLCTNSSKVGLTKSHTILSSVALRGFPQYLSRVCLCLSCIKNCPVDASQHIKIQTARIHTWYAAVYPNSVNWPHASPELSLVIDIWISLINGSDKAC